MSRVLILSWEYPPLIEGGLARHVRKLSEALVERDVEVHVLTRGGEESAAEEVAGGVTVHRILEPKRPTDLGEFVAWVERMNSDMLAAGVELGDRYSYDLVHGHDWLVANACDHLAKRFGAPLVTTIHATEHGRARLGLRLLLERALVTDVHVRVEYAWENDLSTRIQGFSGRRGQVFADGGDLVPGDRNVGEDRADTGDDERAVANHQVELACA